MLTTYSSAIIRTTHLTGIFTDIGIIIGRSLRNLILKKNKRSGLWKLRVFIPIASGYFLGGILGTATLIFIPAPYPLLIPATATGWVGFIYIIVRTGYKMKPQKNRFRHLQNLQDDDEDDESESRISHQDSEKRNQSFETSSINSTQVDLSQTHASSSNGFNYHKSTFVGV